LPGGNGGAADGKKQAARQQERDIDFGCPRVHADTLGHDG
jgi:hypothetical protein